MKVNEEMFGMYMGFEIVPGKRTHKKEWKWKWLDLDAKGSAASIRSIATVKVRETVVDKGPCKMLLPSLMLPGIKARLSNNLKMFWPY